MREWHPFRDHHQCPIEFHAWRGPRDDQNVGDPFTDRLSAQRREHIRRLRETGRPAVLTVNGKAEVVVQDSAAYQELLDRLDRAEAIVGINRGLVSIRRGEGRPAEKVFAEIRANSGFGARVK